jgi:hypothetical protein
MVDEALELVRGDRAGGAGAVEAPVEDERARGLGVPVGAAFGAVDDAHRNGPRPGHRAFAGLQVDVEGFGAHAPGRAATLITSLASAGLRMSVSFRLPSVVRARSSPSHSASVALT